MKWVALYWIVALLTFALLVIMEEGEEHPDGIGVAWFGAALCGLGWPVYWSLILVAALSPPKQ